MPGKMRSLLTNLVSSMTEEIPFQAGTASGTLHCGMSGVGGQRFYQTMFTPLTCACPKICPTEVLSTHTEKHVTLWSTRKECDLSLSEVKGLPRMWSLPTQLDRGRLDSGILKCELERLSLGHSQPQLRILWGSSGAMLKTAPLQPITHVPFFQKWPHVLIIPKGSFFCTYWSFLVDRWQMIISRTVEVKGASTKRWGSWNSDQILHSTTSK